MSLNAVALVNTHIGDNDFRYYTDARRKTWTPANAWSGCWAGKARNLITTRDSGGLRITNATDWTGNARHWINDTLADEFNPSAGLTLGDWSTPHWVLKSTAFSSSGGISAVSSLSAAGEFYLAAVCCNSRGLGTRYMWGMGVDNRIRLDQPNGLLSINIAASADTTLAPAGSFPTTGGTETHTPFLVEIWRDGSNVVRAARNGVEVGSNPTMTGTYIMDGFGASGSQGWDEYLMEFFVATAVGTAVQRRELLNFMRVKWGF